MIQINLYGGAPCLPPIYRATGRGIAPTIIMQMMRGLLHLLQNKTIALLCRTTQLFSVKIRDIEGEY